MKLEGTPFTNSDTCHGVAFASDTSPTDIAIIEINGRYPQEGSWAKNRESHEIVTVIEGLGSLSIRGARSEELRVGDVVHIAPGQEFAWDGRMRLAMACSPPFNPQQYEIIEKE